jgi:hypothetical protein
VVGAPVVAAAAVRVAAAAVVRVAAAATGRSTVRDDLEVAVATLWRSAGV